MFTIFSAKYKISEQNCSISEISRFSAQIKRLAPAVLCTKITDSRPEIGSVFANRIKHMRKTVEYSR
jgi:phage gp16-like protein